MRRDCGNRWRRSIAALAIAAPSFLLAAGPAQAKVFKVSSTGDEGDSSLVDDECHATTGTQCTLRAAIQQANATEGPDEIRFHIGNGTGVKTISLGSNLPDVSEQVAINGYTQPGASPNTKVHGDNARLRIVIDGNSHFFRLTSDDNVVRGLVLNDFFTGLVVLGTSNNKIQGNFIGPDVTGTQAAGSSNAIFVSEGSSANVIGGTSPGARNLVSGNEFGILVSDAPGGPVTQGNKIRGNYIGTDRTGKKDLGNRSSGVIISGGATTVGGRKAGNGNVIAFNGDGPSNDGVSITGTENAILRNSIFANDDLGIDLGADGHTLNDLTDADTGPNEGQNFPAITSARTTAHGTKIKGALNSVPGDSFTIELFANPASGDEGKSYLGQTIAVTDAVTGDGSFTFKPNKPVKRGKAITATATNPEGNTSEFSLPRIVSD